MTNRRSRIAGAALLWLGAAGPGASRAAAEDALPPGAVPLPLKGRLTVRDEGKAYYVDGPQVVPKGSAIRVEKDVRIVGVRGASIDVQGGFEVHGTQDHWVRIDDVDFGKTRKPETNFHFDMVDFQGCSFVHGEGETFEGQWTIENATLQKRCKLSVRLAGGFFRVMSADVTVPCRVEVLPTKGKPPEVSFHTSWVKGGLTLVGPSAATVRFVDLPEGVQATGFTSLVVDGCDVSKAITLEQPEEGSFSGLVLTKCNLLFGARLVLRRPTGAKTKTERVKVERFFFADGDRFVVKDADIAARIDDGEDDPKLSVKATWTKPNERRHLFIDKALRMRLPPAR
jgi:hypothetical protein